MSLSLVLAALMAGNARRIPYHHEPSPAEIARREAAAAREKAAVAAGRERRDAREREQLAKRAENRLATQYGRYGAVVRASGTGHERINPIAVFTWCGHIVDGITESGAEHVGKVAACGAVIGEVAPGLGMWAFTRDDAGANIRGPKPRLSVDLVACPDCLRTTAPAIDHSDHGRAVDDLPDSEPVDSDCVCRGGPNETECRAAGCGFCR